ncbi:MAG: class I SAM-dependent methyltransferase [Candidatus Bathyarchaeota archaeon]|nr:class I SAM-dependent methyltransferase [Candidatus Bathyarchaeota archaeon]
MVEVKAQELNYGNWVSARMMYPFGFLGVVFLLLSLQFFLLIVVAAFFFIVLAYFVYARYEFSPRGGDIQTKIHRLVLDRLNWSGQGHAIDIGCGNGVLTVKLSQKYPEAKVTGIDYWGGKWEYSKGVCEKNAAIEQVLGRVSFQKASASKLPFEDEHFDAAISNFVFHEVADAKDKREVIKEALRVVKKGGKFAFQDLFLEKHIYGEVDDLLREIRQWGVENVEFQDTSKADFIPAPLKLPFMLGTIGILYGTK